MHQIYRHILPLWIWYEYSTLVGETHSLLWIHIYCINCWDNEASNEKDNYKPWRDKRYQNLLQDHNQNCNGKTDNTTQKPESARPELRTSLQHIRSLPLTSSVSQIVFSYLFHMRNKEYRTTRRRKCVKEVWCGNAYYMCPEHNCTTPKL